MSDKATHEAEREKSLFTYSTHHIPWFVRLMWLGFWIGAIWYVVTYAIPMAKNYFRP